MNGDHAPSSSFNTQGTIGVLRRFLASRWNGSANFLNLDNMQADEILKESKVIPPGTPGAHKDIGAVMWKLASELYPGLTTLSLGNNDLKTLAPLSQLPQHLPNIQNLSLEGNDLKWTKDLSTFAKNKNGSLKNLRELMLTGNPMQQNAVSAMNEEGVYGARRLLPLLGSKLTSYSLARLPRRSPVPLPHPHPPRPRARHAQGVRHRPTPLLFQAQCRRQARQRQQHRRLCHPWPRHAHEAI